MAVDQRSGPVFEHAHLNGSMRMFAHVVPHRRCPPGHMHRPPTQLWAMGHIMPQNPQLRTRKKQADQGQ